VLSLRLKANAPAADINAKAANPLFLGCFLENHA